MQESDFEVKKDWSGNYEKYGAFWLSMLFDEQFMAVGDRKGGSASLKWLGKGQGDGKGEGFEELVKTFGTSRVGGLKMKEVNDERMDKGYDNGHNDVFRSSLSLTATADEVEIKRQ